MFRLGTAKLHISCVLHFLRSKHILGKCNVPTHCALLPAPKLLSFSLRIIVHSREAKTDRAPVIGLPVGLEATVISLGLRMLTKQQYPFNGQVKLT